jgi:flagellar assembly protein FliH
MLERGALRVEAANGGVEDGPAQWRQAIAEALALC